MMDYKEKELEIGILRIFTKNDEELICYETKDPVDNQVILLKKGDTLISIEAPLFIENVNELNKYVWSLNVKHVYTLIVDHLSTKDYLPDAKLLTTKCALTSLKEGGQKALFNNFVSTFAGKVQKEIREDYTLIENEVNLNGINLKLINKGDDYDVLIPSFGAVYTHMLGHDVHSIVAGANHADTIISELTEFLNSGIDIVLSSHYIPEEKNDIKTKIDYLNDIKCIANNSTNKKEFVENVMKKYPNYKGLNYLDITAGIFFQN